MSESEIQLISVAEGLLAGTLTCEQAATQLKRCVEVGENMAGLVHGVYHYIADEDIRMRDEEYARIQDAELRRLLAKFS
jgi:hypothetical protein